MTRERRRRAVAEPAPSGDILARMIGAAKLDVATYEEIEADKSATGQAAFVVVATAIAAGVGGTVRGPEGGVLFGILALVAWAIQAWLIMQIGTRLFRGPDTRADWGEVARAVGFAQTPRLLLFLAAIPPLAQLVTFVVGIWMLLTTIAAIRAALDVDLGRAIATAFVSAFAQGILLAFLGVG